MQRKRNIQLLILLVVLVASITVVFLSSRKGGESSIDKTIFKVEDLSQVDHVVLAHEGKKVDLKFDGTRWKVNNLAIDRRMVDVLFATLQQAEPKRPVAASIQDSINTEMNKHAVKVSLFAAGEIKMEFLAGGNQAKTQAYFKKPEEQESFVMVIPGYRVYTSGIFELDENGWRDKRIFNFNWGNFQNLKAVDYNNPKENFEVVMGKNYFEVKDMAAVDTTKLNNFLDAVSLMTVDTYVDSQSVAGISSPKEIMEIQVNDVSGKAYTLTLSDISGPNVLALMNGNQYAYIDKRKVVSILKKRSWFAKK